MQDLARLVLKHGANVNEKDKDDATPLHLASYYKRLEIVRVLLEHAANTEMENNESNTPLQIVIRGNGDSQGDGVGIARLLLEYGAEAYARDKYHISTSDLACCFGKEKIGQVLLGNGGVDIPEDSWDPTFRLWIEGEHYSQGHTPQVSHTISRVWRRWQHAWDVRNNPVTFRIIPGKFGNGGGAA